MLESAFIPKFVEQAGWYLLALHIHRSSVAPNGVRSNLKNDDR